MKHNTRFGLLDVDLESVVRSQALVHEDAGERWQDGHILGNGDLGVVAYAPYGLEWTVNKVDVFDSRNAPKKRLKYRDVIAEARRRGAKNLAFLEEIEKPDTRRSPKEPLLKSCGQVKVRTEQNEFSWGAPMPYRIRQTLSLWDATDTFDMQLPHGHHTSPRDMHRPHHTRVQSFVCRDRKRKRCQEPF
jgi:hypothetical protein